MVFRTERRRQRGILAVILTTLAFLVWPALVPSGSDEQGRATAWARARAARLPVDIRALAGYPETYQEAAYQALPAASRRELWKQYLRATADGSELTATQRSFLQRFADTVTVADFEPRTTESAGMQALMQDIQPFLGDRSSLIRPGAWKQATRWLNPLDVGLGRTLDSAMVRMSEFLLSGADVLTSRATVSADLIPCQCWVAENGRWNCPEPPDHYRICIPNTPGPPYLCQTRYDAYSGPCSLFGNKPCNGLCTYVHNCSGNCDASADCCSYCQGTWMPEGYCNTGSPILINLERNGGDRLTSAQRGVWFDISARGVRDRVAWTSAGSPVGFLVLDRNGNGVIDDGTELFGSETPLPNGTRAGNGFLALYELDGGAGSSDYRIDASDALYGQLRLWFDDNHNGFSEAAELRTLADAGVTAIFTHYRETRRRDQHGNWYRFAGQAVLERNGSDEERRRIFDVFFKVATE